MTSGARYFSVEHGFSPGGPQDVFRAPKRESGLQFYNERLLAKGNGVQGIYFESATLLISMTVFDVGKRTRTIFMAKIPA